MSLFFTKLFQPVLLTASVNVVYVIPSSNGGTTLLRNGRLRLTNTTTSSVSATLYAVPNGNSVGDENEFFPNQSIGPNQFVDVDIPQMVAGDSIYGLAGVTQVIAVAAMDGILQT